MGCHRARVLAPPAPRRERGATAEMRPQRISHIPWGEILRRVDPDRAIWTSSAIQGSLPRFVECDRPDLEIPVVRFEARAGSGVESYIRVREIRQRVARRDPT